MQNTAAPSVNPPAANREPANPHGRPRWPSPRPLAAASLAGALLAACGGGGDGGAFVFPIIPAPPDTGRGTLVEAPTRVAQLSAAQFTALLRATDAGRAVEQVAGAPRCGFELHAIHYRTVGGRNEETTASGALMVPTGPQAWCTGKRPVVMYAHGTNADRNYDLGRWTHDGQAAAGEGLMSAAMFAAQGYIVVAPNYAGYAQSTLPYHPYLNATQQGRDAVDAVAAARRVLPVAGAADGGSLLLTGYSQGGHVALAAHREMQSLGLAVTASAPLSAPSAISLLTDYTFQGWPTLGATLFLPLLSTSWQKQFGDVYASPEQMYESRYAAHIEGLLPNTRPVAELIASGALPLTALFPANAVPGPLNPLASLLYGPDNLVRQSYLTAAANDIQGRPCPGNALPATAASLASSAALDCQPDTGFRRAAVANDLRNWLPARPVFFCGGANDPTVNFLSTRATAGYFSARGMPPAALPVLDLEEASPGGADPFAAARAGFALAKTQLYDATDGDAGVKEEAVIRAYHGTLVPPFCMASARGFFETVLASGG